MTGKDVTKLDRKKGEAYLEERKKRL